MYDIRKSKYIKEIDRLSVENKEKLDYKQLKLTDVYQYSSEEEQEKQEKNKKNKIKNQLIQKKLLNGSLIEKNYP